MPSVCLSVTSAACAQTATSIADNGLFEGVLYLVLNKSKYIYGQIGHPNSLKCLAEQTPATLTNWCEKYSTIVYSVCLSQAKRVQQQS